MKSMISLVAGILCAITVLGSYDYDETARTLTATVTGEEAFDETYLSLLTGNSVVQFIKKGAGELKMGAANAAGYNGEIIVREGVLSYTAASALGSTAADVRVENKATLCCRATATLNLDSSGIKKVYFEGNGCDGQGALRSCGVGQEKGPFGRNLILTGDALYVAEASGGFPYGTKLDMDGYHLTGTPASGSLFRLSGMQISNAGSISVANGTVFVSDGIAWDGSADNVMTTACEAVEMSALPAGTALPWTWVLTDPVTWFYVAENTTTEKLNPLRNCWQGPLVLDVDNLNIAAVSASAGVSFSGPISGKGGITVLGDIDGTKPHRRDLHVHLSSSANNFGGGMDMRKATLHLWKSGALPANGSSLKLTDATAVLEDDEGVYSLPGLEATGNSTVTNGAGTWAGGIVKNGTGCLTLDTWVDAPSLTVNGGSVSLVRNGTLRRSAVAGLIGGVYSNGVDYTSTTAYPTCSTNSVELTASALYDNTHPWWSGSHPRCVVYSGYLWNNASTNALWSFAGCAVMHMALYVNDTRVIYHTGSYASTTNSCILKPGANKIQVRIYAKNSGGPSWAVQDGSAIYPWGYLGFPRYKIGAPSNTADDYLPLTDPGDGSLLTWTDTPDAARHPLTGAAVSFGDIPTMAFASGTSISFNGSAATLDTLSGCPTVTNSSVLTVTNVWRLSATDIAAGAKLTTDGCLVFASGARIVVTGKAPAGTYTVAQAAKGIEGEPEISYDASKGSWRLSVEKGVIKLVHTKPGLLLNLK